MKPANFALLLAIVGLAASPLAALAQSRAVTIIDCDSSATTVVTGLNDAGQVVGWTGDISQATGFVRDRHDASCQALRFPEAASTLPTAIDDRGQVVGFYFDSSGQQKGFLYYHGEWTTIAFPGACQTVAIGINNRGEVVGYYDASTDCDGPDAAFLREPNGTLVALPNPGFPDSWQANGINARGDIAGAYNATATDPSAENGFLLAKGDATPVPITAEGFGEVFPTSINAAGDIVGVLFPVFQEFPIGPGCQGFYRKRDGGLELLGNLDDAVYTCTFGLNASGDVSGTYIDASGGTHGFVASKETLEP